ncbi:MAG: single-stranded-DNA-specific exonuclease RecJ [Opitutales bacterium]|nr:single-stranded-DNA-specific exonuclease RecJ [Opitutales bacterium]MCH8540458.1 single-stranded-DNA-specific exonuclease RecJ [Opitutales bacterium]
MQDRWKLHPLLAELLVRLDLGSDAEVEEFLEPRLKNLSDPFALGNLRAAAERVVEATNEKEKIVVLGDYDVDGVTSTAFMVAFLRALGADPSYFVPLRMEEGYGMSRSALERILAEGEPPKLFIAVDCGTNSIEEVAFLREQGVEVIILDHHRSKESTPDDCLLVNPFLDENTDQPWTSLCSAGLVFKLAHGILKYLREIGDDRGNQIDVREFLDLAAMGTIADMVPLRQENRILARHGLKGIAEGCRPGLKALLEVSGLKESTPLRPSDISFRVGPRINASGRLADASLPVDMLLSEDEAFCRKIARQLNDFNAERQLIERTIVREAEEQLKETTEVPAGIVLFNDGWHPGVVGIVSSRLSRKYMRPTIVLGWEGEFAKGSGRSVPGLSLVKVLEQCDDLLENWGGHPQAVGVSLRRENVPAFQERFAQVVDKTQEGVFPEPELHLAGWVSIDELEEDLFFGLDRLNPFGIGNEEPIIGIKDIVLQRPPKVFSEKHFRFTIRNRSGLAVQGVAWKLADRIPPLNQSLEMACRLSLNHFRDKIYRQLEVIDWRPQ